MFGQLSSFPSLASVKFLSRARAKCVCVAVLWLFLSAGCGKSGDGLSDYERAQQKYEDAASALRAAGGEVTTVHYAQGDGWGVKLKGAQITDDTFLHLKNLKRVAELDVSKSSIKDEQLAQLNEQGVGNLIVKLDLSHTAVSDAGLDHLTNLHVLCYLRVVGTKVTAAGAARLQQRRANTIVKIPLPPLVVER